MIDIKAWRLQKYSLFVIGYESNESIVSGDYVNKKKCEMSR